MLGKNRLCIKVSICVLYFLTSRKQQYLLKISRILTFGSIKKIAARYNKALHRSIKICSFKIDICKI